MWVMEGVERNAAQHFVQDGALGAPALCGRRMPDVAPNVSPSAIAPVCQDCKLILLEGRVKP